MANVNHSTLTDPYLHEPKGVSTASSGDVYIADGVGSGSWKQPKQFISGHYTFSTASPYSQSITTSDAQLTGIFNVIDSNGFNVTLFPSTTTYYYYEGSDDIHARVHASFSIKQASGGDRQIELVFAKNTTVIPGSRVVVTSTSGDWHHVTLNWHEDIISTDDLRVYVRADSACTVEFASGFFEVEGTPV